MKIYTGKVIAKKMEKTATVVVERIYTHSIYKKRIKRDKKYHVHETLGAKVDQMVQFTDCKPYSKTKKWKIIKIVSAINAGKRKISRKKSQKLAKTK